jgi:hypothetical protein
LQAIEKEMIDLKKKFTAKSKQQGLRRGNTSAV